MGDDFLNQQSSVEDHNEHSSAVEANTSLPKREPLLR